MPATRRVRGSDTWREPSGADATLVTVDPATGKVLGRVPTGEGPHEVTVSAVFL